MYAYFFVSPPIPKLSCRIQPFRSPLLVILTDPYHLGLQEDVIRDSVPNGLPLNETTIANILQDAGYRTHMIGSQFILWKELPIALKSFRILLHQI